MATKQVRVLTVVSKSASTSAFRKQLRTACRAGIIKACVRGNKVSGFSVSAICGDTLRNLAEFTDKQAAQSYAKSKRLTTVACPYGKQVLAGQLSEAA